MLREIIVNLIILCGPSPTCHLVSISITKFVTFFCTSYNSVVNTSPPSCLNLTESHFLLFTYASYNYLKSYRHETFDTVVDGVSIVVVVAVGGVVAGQT